MTEDEARRTLRLGPQASQEELRAAYQALLDSLRANAYRIDAAEAATRLDRGRRAFALLSRARPAAEAEPDRRKAAPRRTTGPAIRAAEDAAAPPPSVWMTRTLVAANCLVFALFVWKGGGLLAPDVGKLVAWGANFSALIQEGQVWRLLSATFLHGGIDHLIGNMIALYAFGRLLERLQGPGFFLLIYLSSGLAGSVVSLYSGMDRVGVGASGAIFGVVGALAPALAGRHHLLSEGKRLLLFAGTLAFTVYAFWNGIQQDGIDNGAHAGGFFCGLLLGILPGPPARVANVVARRRSLAYGGVIAAVLALAFVAPAAGLDAKGRLSLIRSAQKLMNVEARLANDLRHLGTLVAAGRIGEREAEEMLRNATGRYGGVEVDLIGRPMPTEELERVRQKMLDYLGLRRDGLTRLA
ncbi:MAG: rhomboid family intramembrane serine protease, partial [Rhodocyclaceae bacterium]|nr:rhomboid family intramembrane serine protease [Rhodocyclaceae bacterium]